MRTKALVFEKRGEMDWSGFEHALHDRFGVNAVTLTMSGDRKTAGGILWANSLCALIKTNPKGAKRICGIIQQILMREAAARRRYATDECAAGIYRIMVPIVVQDELDGFVSVCGRPFSTADRIYTEYIHRTIDEDQEKIESLLSSLRPIGPRTLKEMRQFISGVAH
jgi:ligand-binding sensor protein